MALNFHEAVSGLPLTGDALESFDESELQICLFRLLERLVEQTERPGNEPDEYEREQLGAAIKCMTAGFWQSVYAKAVVACTPLGDRVPVLDGGILEVQMDRSLRQLLSGSE